MKLIIERSNLLAALTTCKATVEARTTIPILACVRLSASGAELSVTGTDHDLETTDRVAAEVLRPGELCVNHGDLHDLVRRLPDGAEIALDHDGLRLEIRAGRTKASLLTLGADIFPKTEAAAWEHEFQIPVGHLVKLLAATEFAMSDEEVRFWLNGVYLHTREKEDGKAQLAAAATDGHRLSWAHTDLPDAAAGMRAVIIPRKTVSTILPLLAKRADKDATEPVACAVSETKLSVALGHWRMLSKLIDGRYPDYLRVIPANPVTFVKMPRRQLELASGRAVAILDKESKQIRLAFNGEQDDGLTLTSASATTTAEIEDHLNVILEGPAQTIAVNGQYLVTGLGSFASDDITLSISDPQSPLILSDDQDDSRGVVIMPMRG
ncbi:DNA polymerase III subunit beta [Kaistia adipata]|uniref:DNA polymerase III subunit beta n=1 Tax=Kaistia adipata TaxID=166954 RepID=UPI0003F74C2C|nr:DNA polymerase III subunit beta [Kaistia adipata]